MDKFFIKHNNEWKEKAILLGVVDVLTILASYFFALILRFDFIFSAIELKYVDGYFKSIGFWVIVTNIVFFIFRLYHSIWSLASAKEMLSVLKSYIVLIPIYWILAKAINLDMPRSYYLMGILVNFCCTIALRFSYRLIRIQTQSMKKESKNEDRIMIIGAGAAGQMLIKELQSSNKLNTRVCWNFAVP